MHITSLLQEKISRAVTRAFDISTVDFIVEHPANDQFGDFATNVALVLSKIVKQPPQIIAKTITSRLEEILAEDGQSDIIETTQVAGPGFINFKISNKWLIKLLDEDSDASNNYGVISAGAKKRIALEHSNVNPNKAIHVGHLRNACIGQFIDRAYEMQGYDVDVQYYANNVGVQVATSKMGIEKITDISPTSYKKFDHYAWDVYAKMESQIEASPQLQSERLQLLEKLENPESTESIAQREIANKILVDQLKSFAALGFDYDVVIYESDILAKKLWEAAFARLKTQSNVYFATEGPSKGCWLVKVDNTSNHDTTTPEDVEADKIIVRSNGVPTYTGKDIAYHMWKFGLLGMDFSYKKWPIDTQKKDLWVTTYKDNDNEATVSFSGVDYVFDVIGVEQTYAIDVVKKSLAFLGYAGQAENMKHINYGFVFLSADTAQSLGIDTSDGKKFYAMSGRKGWGVKVDDLIDQVDAQLTKTYGEFDALSKVRNAAIKFQMLKLNTFQDLIFDLNEALDIKGYSGPYLQYAYVRANSILNKAGSGAGTEKDVVALAEKLNYKLEQKELDLIKYLVRFPEIIDTSSKMFAPNVLCEYLFDLSKRFNTFYNDLSILNAESTEIKAFRLALCYAFAQILKKGLWVLGIETAEKM